MTITALREAFRSGAACPREIIREISAGIDRDGLAPVWISVRTVEDMLADLEAASPDAPLYGIPFAVKDNIDIAGMPTTAACPAFSRIATETAFAVARLRAAGAIVVGKTNMDQFATGLVGSRSPYGVGRSLFHPDYVSGGSSSGSALAVAGKRVAFSLGTDTAGSGRVPAAFNNLVGFKPTRGIVSTAGVVPACASLDCLSIFSHTVDDAMQVLAIAAGENPEDPWSRREVPATREAEGPWVLGVPRRADIEFFGDAAAEALFFTTIEEFAAAGVEIREIDIGPFLEGARLLYGGAWVAERDLAFGDFLRRHSEQVNPVVRDIIAAGAGLTARDAFQGFHRLQALRKSTEPLWLGIDALLLPTVPTGVRVADLERDPIGLNARLGIYTNFVNLFDLCALAVPSGFRPDGLPLGVTLIAPAFHDAVLARIATGTPRPVESLDIAVVGAHLRGQPLNFQLTSRGAVFKELTRTAPAYRLHALATTPPKPGLVRVPTGGASIEVEVWSLSPAGFGAFVAEIPPPLGIGTLELEDGRAVKGFLCEPFALEGAPDISACGGWRAYLATRPAK